jgi:hypothetical protein
MPDKGDSPRTGDDAPVAHDETPVADDAPYFFLSHAHAGASEVGGDPDVEVVDLFHLMCKHIRQLTSLPVDVDPGYLDLRVQVGTSWHAELQAKLATCRVFVPLYSPRLFTSQWCGWEWDAFVRREAAHAARQPAGHPYPFSAIVPVIWARVADDSLPRCARRLQYSDSRFGGEYRKQGLYSLLILDEPSYKRAVLRITQTIIDVADATRLRACAPSLFDPPRNAFEDRN